MSNPPEIKNNQGDVIGVGIDGNGNIIGKDITVVINQTYSYGLTMIRPNHFRDYSNTNCDFEQWKRGYQFTKESIYYHREYRRDRVIIDIKTKLERWGRLLILGETGTSKSTVLMEFIADYFNEGYKVLYNEGDEEIRNHEEISSFLRDLANAGNRILVVVDNVHEEKTSAIFASIRSLQTFDKNYSIRFILCARQPEYEWLIERYGGRTQAYIQAIDSLFNGDENKKYRYKIPNFSEEDVAGFIEKYKRYLDDFWKNKSTEEITKAVFELSEGNPLLTRFFVIQGGLEPHVKKVYREHLTIDGLPNVKKLETVIISALYDIASIPLNEQVLVKMGLRQCALELNRTILHKVENSWKTFHPKWDQELFSYLLSMHDEIVKDEIKKAFSNSLKLIFSIRNATVSYSIITNLYNLSALKIISYSLVDEITEIPEYLETKKSELYALVIGPTLAYLGRNEEALSKYDLSIEINSKNQFSYYGKARLLETMGKLEEAEENYDKFVELDGSFHKVTFLSLYRNKAELLAKVGRYDEALIWYNKYLSIEHADPDSYIDKALLLIKMKREKEALDTVDLAIRSFNWVYSGSEDPYLFYLKGEILQYLGRNKEANTLFEKAFSLDPFATWKMIAHSLHSSGEYQHAIESYQKALEIKRDDADTWYEMAKSKVMTDQLANALDDLKMSIELGGDKWRTKVREDEEFHALHTDENFRKLVDE